MCENPKATKIMNLAFKWNKMIKECSGLPQVLEDLQNKVACEQTNFKDNEKTTLFISRTSQHFYLIRNIIPTKTYLSQIFSKFASLMSLLWE